MRTSWNSNIRLGGRFYFNLEVNANVLGDKYNSKKAGNPDWVGIYEK